jgi:hypothetical protein
VYLRPQIYSITKQSPRRAKPFHTVLCLERSERNGHINDFF